MKDHFDPEQDPQPRDPMELLSEGMRPLPEDTDMDLLTASYDLIGRMGAGNFEVGFDDALDPKVQWYAKATYPTAPDQIVSGRESAHQAAFRLARKMANGGRCTHCGKIVSLDPYPGTYDSSPRPHLRFCYWWRPSTAPKRFERGCIDTHAEGERTAEAINEFIERTGSPARREV